MTSALALIALAIISGVTMGMMRAHGTLPLPIPVFSIHAGMVLSAAIILLLNAG